MSLPAEISDGNGGLLDPQKTPQRDLLVALHVKVDEIRSAVRDHETRLRGVEKRLDVRDGEDATRRILSDRTLARISLFVASLAAVASFAVALIHG